MSGQCSPILTALATMRKKTRLAAVPLTVILIVIGGTYLPKEQSEIKTETCQVELPQAIIETFARFLVPEIRKYYNSEQGQRELAEWQAAQGKTE